MFIGPLLSDAGATSALASPAAFAGTCSERSLAPVSAAELHVVDGGGLQSTACWLRPQAVADLLRPLRRELESLVVSWQLIPRLRDRLTSADQFFTEAESQHVRCVAARFLRDRGFPCCVEVRHFQPYSLDIWQSFAALTMWIAACPPS